MTYRELRDRDMRSAEERRRRIVGEIARFESALIDASYGLDTLSAMPASAEPDSVEALGDVVGYYMRELRRLSNQLERLNEEIGLRLCA